MRQKLYTLAVVICLCVGALPQSLRVGESPKEPGDPLRYTIRLDAPVKGKVNMIYVSFKLTTPIHDDQRGLPTNFDLTTFSETSPTEYKVVQATPNAMSGTYQLVSIQLRVEGGGTRDYLYPGDFKDNNKVEINNPAKDVFPNIKSVTPH